MSSLSEQELRSIRDELAAGGTPTVWFTNSAVGVPEGRSGKVVSLGEPAEGDFIQVRPAGTKDVLSFSNAEVTQVKPVRKRSTPAKTTADTQTTAAGKTTVATASDRATTARAEAVSPATGSTSGSTGGGASSSGTSSGSTTSRGEKAAAPEKSTTTRSTTAKTRQPAGRNTPAATSSPNTSPAGAASGSKSSSGKRPARPSGATVTLAADENGQWTVEVSTGKKRTVRPTQVSPNAVAEAAKALHGDVAAAVEPLIDAAREQQRARVEQLRAELASAEEALGELDR